VTAALYTIPVGAPFLDRIATGALARLGEQPQALHDAIILLPTRRAVRGLRESFQRVLAGRAALLPRMAAIGDIDDDELLVESAAFDAMPEIGPAIAPRERLALLAELVRVHAVTQGDPAIAVQLARALATLIDAAALNDISLDALDHVVEGDLAAHWQRSLDVLRAAQREWPRLLAQRGLIDPAVRRIALLRARAELWRRAPPSGLVIAAGSTGTIPATADLLRVIAGLPRGFVVLPGLDRELDSTSWEAVHDDPTHPQHALAVLLRRLDVTRQNVKSWSEDAEAPRAVLLREALRPAATTDAWRATSRHAAVSAPRRLATPDAQLEAVAIAIALREAIAVPGKRAALVTADRTLARRVAAELQRWGLRVDDSGGTALSRTPPGAWLGLIAELACDPSDPIKLLAVLKHPLACGGEAREAFLRRARNLDRKALRGLRPAAGLQGLRDAVRRLREEAALIAWVERLVNALDSLAMLAARASVPPAVLLEEEMRFALWLAASDVESGEERLYAGDVGTALRRLIDESFSAFAAMAPVAGADWPRLLDAWMQGEVVRPLVGQHPRLAILGPLEARLQNADLVILGALEEGNWPPSVGDDPWLSRAMRQRLGLPPAERRIGQSAHDFVQAASASEVILSHSRKRDGSPTTPSRWLQRLDAYLGADPDTSATNRDHVLDWALTIDRPTGVVAIKPPEPRPPRAARPRRIAVSHVTTWVRDPYAIYARDILALRPLDPHDLQPGPRERGIFVHRALAAFLEEIADTLPADAEARLLAAGRRSFGALLARPVIGAVWWPRFERMAKWLVGWERRRRASGTTLLAIEAEGAMEVPGTERFMLEARADRIDRLADGTLAIIDFKTGATPSVKQVWSGLAPQLPLEAAIARRGGFKKLEIPPALPVGELRYLRLTGAEPPGEDEAIEPKRDNQMSSVDALTDDLLKRFAGHVRRYADESTPYRSGVIRESTRDVGDYDHLARRMEWSQAESDGEGES
jgi:ATP-dependent helicase/nuclease subunit B